jgi:hypothetical protein
MRFMSVLSASAAALMLTLSVAAAQTAPTGNSPSPTTNANSTPTTQVSQAPGTSDAMDHAMATTPSDGNSLNQGRYYDGEDQYLDPSTGASGPGAPADHDNGG